MKFIANDIMKSLSVFLPSAFVILSQVPNNIFVAGQKECSAGLVFCPAYDDCIRPERETCPEADPAPVGGDVDEFGCKPSAGEEWCASLRECVRPFDEDSEPCPDYSTPPPVPATPSPVPATPSPIVPVVSSAPSDPEPAPVPSPTPEPVSPETVEPEEDIIVGADKDEYGCIGSAGFSWCQPLQACIRPWETDCPVPDDDCKTLTEIVCGSPDLSDLCKLVKKAKLADKLSKGSYTVFAPRNGAFDDVDKHFDDWTRDRLRRLLLFHVVPDRVLFSSDLQCKSPDNLITMANDFDSRTLCDDGKPKYQKGRKNSDKNKPKIVDVDNKACNGVAHILSDVMLYKDY